jgi:hypothetical protein
VSSAAHTTSPERSLITAIPLVFDPGSSLTRSGSITASGRVSLRGKRRRIAALRCLSKRRARAGVHGISGLRSASTIKMRDILEVPFSRHTHHMPPGFHLWGR